MTGNLPNVVTLAKVINRERAFEGYEQEDLEAIVGKARNRFKREFKSEGDLAWAFWNYLSRESKDRIYNNLDSDKLNAVTKEADTYGCLPSDVNPYFDLEATAAEKLSLTFPDTSKEAFTHYLRHLPGVTTLIALRTGDDSKEHVELEVKKLVAGLKASGWDIISERDSKVLAWEVLSEDQKEEWRSRLPGSIQGFDYDTNPYVLPEGLEDEHDIFVEKRLIPAIQGSNLSILDNAPNVFVTMPPPNTKPDDENDDATSRHDTENIADDSDLAKGGKFSHRYDCKIWSPGMAEATPPAKPGPGKKNKQGEFEHFPLYMEWINMNKDNLPPPNVRLSDWHVYKVLELKMNGKKRCERWPADFASDGEVRRDRPPHGWPAKGNVTSKDGRSVFHYMMYRGYYILCGDEGVANGVQHLVDEDTGTKGNAYLTVSSVEAAIQLHEGPKKLPAAPKPPKPRTPNQPTNSGTSFTPINKPPASSPSTDPAKQHSSPPSVQQRPATSEIEMPWDTVLRSVRPHQPESEPERSNDYLAAIQRGDRLRDLNAEAMMRIMDADNTRRRNHAEITERIQAAEHQLQELRLERDRVYEEETVELMSIPKQYTTGLTANGLEIDLEEFTGRIRGWKGARQASSGRRGLSYGDVTFFFGWRQPVRRAARLRG